MKLNIGSRIKLKCLNLKRWDGELGTIIGVFNNNSFHVQMDNTPKLPECLLLTRKDIELLDGLHRATERINETK